MLRNYIDLCALFLKWDWAFLLSDTFGIFIALKSFTLLRLLGITRSVSYCVSSESVHTLEHLLGLSSCHVPFSSALVGLLSVVSSQVRSLKILPCSASL